MPLPPLPVDPEIERLAKKMRELRAVSGLTYDALAERTGMSRRGVIEYEQGRTNGTMRHWYRIAQALNVPFSEFVKVLD